MKINKGATQFGYIVGNSGVEIVEDEAFTLNKMYDMYLQELPIIRIVERLNELKLYSKRGKEWTNTSLNKLLLPSAIKFYAGLDENDKPGDWPPIISEHVYKRISALRQKSKIGQKRNSPETYLLSGMGVFTCGYCNGSVKASVTKRGKIKDLYYLCKNRQVKSRSKCHESKLVKQEIINEIIENYIKEFISNKELIYVNYENYLRSKLVMETTAVSNSLNSNKTNFEKLKDSFLQSTQITERFLEDNKMLDTLKPDLKDPDNKRKLVTIFVKNIKLYRENLKVEFNFPLPNTNNFEVEIPLW